jgi:hypothetical protein
MRLKTIIFPVTVVIATAASIGYVYPEYQMMLANQGTLAKKQELLESVTKRAANMTSLQTSYESDQASKNTVMSFMPMESSEESLLNAVHRTITDSGAVISDLSAESVLDKAESIPEGMDSAALAADQAFLEKISFRKGSTSMTIKAAGQYAGLKGVLEKMQGFPRSNSIERLSLFSEESKKEGADPNILFLEVTSKYAYAPMAKLRSEQTPAIFSQSAFDFAFLSKLKPTPFAPVMVDQSGRENPFLP